jgi:cobalt-zinc-cadmium efflux system outer membrane protein
MRAWPLIGRCVGAVLVAATAPAAAGAQTAAVPPAPAARVGLADAVRLALDRNHQLRAQRLNVDLSKADEITAALKPNPNFLSTNELFPVFNPSQLTWNNFVHNQNFVQSVSYLFERGGKREQRTQVARDTTDAVSQAAADVERQLAFQTEQAFVNVLLANSTLDLARENLTNFTSVVDVNRNGCGPAISPKPTSSDPLQKLQFEQDLSSAEVAVVQAKAALRQNVGYENLTDDFEIDGELAYRKYVVTLDDLKRDALAARPDLLAARTGVALAEHTLALAQATKTRDITGGLEYDRAGSLNAIGFTVSIDRPINDRNQGNIARSRSRSRRRRNCRRLPEARFSPTWSRRTRRFKQARRSWRSTRPVTSIRRSSRLTSPPMCTSRAAARCSTCSTPSARIVRRSWPTARHWRRT